MDESFLSLLLTTFLLFFPQIGHFNETSNEDIQASEESPFIQSWLAVVGNHREDRVMRPPTRDVSETDLYLLGAIEKLAYRLNFMEKRLRRTEDLLYYVMDSAGQSSNKELQLPTDPDPCPTNFTRVGQKCYHFGDREFNWKSAASMCKSMGSTLAELETIEENQDVVTFIQTRQEYKGKDFWTGGLNPGLLWIWANSARPVSSNTTDTSNAIKGSGRCLKLAYNPALRSYAYKGAECSERIPYFCEHEENSTSRALERIAKLLKDEKHTPYTNS